MIFWAWKGRIVLLRNEVGTNEPNSSPEPNYQEFELVEVRDPALYRDDSKILILRLNTGYCHYVSRRDCYPLRKTKKLFKK